jgi:phosphinothricin acetyltransferase
MEPFQFVHCGERHVPAITALLNEAILHTTALYDYVPRQPSAMKAWLEKKKEGNYPVIGAEAADGSLLGFASYGPFRYFPAYKYSIEHSVYVEHSQQRRGIGKKLLLELIATAQRQNYHMMIGGIDSENAASIQLHLALGFSHCATIRHAGFKFGRWLDLAFYQLLLPTPTRPVDG